MNILLQYLKPHKWLVFLTLLLASINTGFSLLDPILLGKLVNLAGDHQTVTNAYVRFDFFWGYETVLRKGKPYLQLGVFYILIFSISVAMISRIAKAFQDYTLNLIIQKFGAKLFTDGGKLGLVCTVSTPLAPLKTELPAPKARFSGGTK